MCSFGMWGAVDLLAPDCGGDSGAAEESAAGRSADAAYFRLHARVDLGQSRKQILHDCGALHGRRGGLFYLREFAGYFDLEFFLRLLYLRVDDFHNFLQRHGRKDAAVEAEYFAPRHGVYVGDVRAAARRLECGLGRVEEAVSLREGRVQRLVESYGKRVRGAAGVVAEVRRAAVHLFPSTVNSIQQTLFSATSTKSALSVPMSGTITRSSSAKSPFFRRWTMPYSLPISSSATKARQTSYSGVIPSSFSAQSA